MKILASLSVALAAAAIAAPASAQPAREHVELVESLGGQYLGPQADYVQKVGERMVQATGLKKRCVFTVLNSEVVNAFTAPPGCYVYITRGLLSIMNSEAELAAVLGHELGHVAANHARRQQQAEQLSGLAAALVGAYTRSDIVGGIAGQAAKLGTLGYSRSQEYEADQLALRYLPLAGYSPDGMTRVLDDLQREDEFSTRAKGRSDAGGAPAWARTHPLTTDRIQRARAQADRESQAEGLQIDEAAYLTAIDGLPLDDAEDQGVVHGRVFTHPGLGIRFEAPQSFKISNTADAVRLTGPSGTLAEFRAGKATSAQLAAYAQGVLLNIIRQGRYEMGQPQRTTINGLPAVVLPARAWSSGRPVDLTCVAYSVGGEAVYHFVTLAPQGQAAVFDPLYESFRKLSDRERDSGGGRRIAVTSVKSGDTVESLAAQMAPDIDNVGRFRMLNGLQPDQPLRPGSKVKIVVEGRR